jgi:hypothetical protein
LVFSFGFLKDRICLLPLFAGYIQGRLNFIPFRLATYDLCGIALVLYYIVAYTALQRKIMKTGPLVFFIPILIFLSIVVYHEHDFGLRAFGGGREGAKGALFMELSSIAYLCGVSVNTPRASFFARIPLICIFLSIVSSIPYTISTYFPSLSPYLALLTSNINATALGDAAENGEVVRNSGIAGVGAIVMVYLLSYYPLHTWFRPQRFWMIIVGLACTWSVVMGGFRGALFTFAVTVLIGASCHYRWRSLILLPPMVFAVFFVMAVQDSHIVRLPPSAQRTLDFLPGDWDPEVVATTESSNDFRDKIKAVYIREELRKSPFFGNGFSYDSDEFAKMNYLALTQETPDGYYSTKIFVTGKMFHIGWISLYDSVGLVGAAVFLFFEGALIWRTGREIYSRDVDRQSSFFGLRIWMFCNLVSAIVAFFTVYGDIKLNYPGLCYFAILWTHMNRLESQGYVPPVKSSPELSFDPVRGEAPAYH